VSAAKRPQLSLQCQKHHTVDRGAPQSVLHQRFCTYHWRLNHSCQLRLIMLYVACAGALEPGEGVHDRGRDELPSHAHVSLSHGSVFTCGMVPAQAHSSLKQVVMIASVTHYLQTLTSHVVLRLAFVATQAHSSLNKACMIAGVTHYSQTLTSHVVLRLDFVATQAHSSLKKACMIAGVTHCRVLATEAGADWALAPKTLEAAIQEDLQVCCRA